MPTYMFQGCYTSGAIAAMVKKPQDRTAAVRELTKSLGGKLEGFWLAFGEMDFVGIAQLPDSEAALAFALAVEARGSISELKTTELLTWSDGMDAFKKAGAATYRPPTMPIK